MNKDYLHEITKHLQAIKELAVECEEAGEKITVFAIAMDGESHSCTCQATKKSLTNAFLEMLDDTEEFSDTLADIFTDLALTVNVKRFADNAAKRALSAIQTAEA